MAEPMNNYELSESERGALNLAADLMADQPCCGAGLVAERGHDETWRIMPRGREYTIGLGPTLLSAVENAHAACGHGHEWAYVPCGGESAILVAAGWRVGVAVETGGRRVLAVSRPSLEVE